MCLVCRAGEQAPPPLEAMRREPRIPVRLHCRVESVFAFQNPSSSGGREKGDLFERKRDLDILQRLGMVPGAVRPADELILSLFRAVNDTRGICRHDAVSAEAWRGCPEAESGRYESVRAQGLGMVIPVRGDEEKARAKAESVAEVYAASELRIRPHHLMCLACFHGGKDELAAITEDNLFEVIDVVQKNPVIPILLVPGCCQICPPCSHYDPQTNWCVAKVGAGLRDEKKDLDVLQMLGMRYGDRLPARELFGLLFERIPSTRSVCAYGDGVVRAQEWTICGGPDGNPDYIRARDVGLGIPGI